MANNTKTPKTENDDPRVAPEEQPGSEIVFELEENFPRAGDLFAAHDVSLKAKSDVLICVDTNALLLPYSIGTADLKAIATVYRKLGEQKRLYVSARAVREFIRQRDRHLASIVKSLRDGYSLIKPANIPSLLLEELEGYKQFVEGADKLEEARKEYGKAIDLVVKGIRAWRGNDPVSALYREVFQEDQIVDVVEERSDILKEWLDRRRSKRPPGYKDAGKDDTGIGDFLIWKSILRLGKEQKLDLAFVTGESKSDWFVRSDREPIYPRPELIDEYRQASGGKNITLLSLADLLSEFDVTKDIVTEVRVAEDKANTAVRQHRTEPLQGWVPTPPATVGPLGLGSFLPLTSTAVESFRLTAPSRVLWFVSGADPAATLHHLLGFFVPPKRRISPTGMNLLCFEYEGAISDEIASAVLAHAKTLHPSATWMMELLITGFVWQLVS